VDFPLPVIILMAICLGLQRGEPFERTFGRDWWLIGFMEIKFKPLIAAVNK